MPRRAGSRTLARKIGARLRALREERGLTQERLAWECDFSKAYVSQIEAGQRVPSLPALVSFAKRLGVEPLDVLALDGRSPRAQLVEAVRKGDREAVAKALAKLGITL